MSIFSEQIGDGIFILCSDSFGKSMELGAPTSNSYLVIGDDKALLFDLAVNEPGLCEYVAVLAGKPVMTVISHGHFDHLYHVEDFKTIFIHNEDKSFHLYGALGLSVPEKLPEMSFLNDGDIIDLGNRRLSVICIPGHTPGSILLLDEKTKSLFSGDTVARRLLYGTSEHTSLKDFTRRLKALQGADIEHIYSCHDRADLGPEYIGHMISCIVNELPYADRSWFHPATGKMINLVHGVESDPLFFDLAVPENEV